MNTLQERMIEWTSGLLEGNLTDEDRTQLTTALRSDPFARRIYVNLIDLHVELARRTGKVRLADVPMGTTISLAPHSSEASIPASLASPRKNWFGYDWTVGALVIAGVVGAFWGLWQVMSLLPTRMQEIAAVEPVADIVWEQDVRWIGATVDAAQLPSGKPLQIENGKLQVAIRNGATLSIGGPASWSIDSRDRVQLRVGTLIAKVPPHAIGFKVITPSAEIVDLGTEFAVSIGKNGETAVRVLTGQVEATPRKDWAISVGNATTFKTHKLNADELAVIARPNEAVTATIAESVGVKAVAALLAEAPANSITFGPPRMAISLSANPGIPSQNYAGSLGMDFVANKQIEITRLGAYDHGGDGFADSTKLDVEIWQRSDQGTINPADDQGVGLITAVQFTADKPGELVGGYRWLPLKTPLRVWPGAFTIVARGFGPQDLIGNWQRHPAKTTLDEGDAAIKFVGLSRFGSTAFPLTVDQGSPVQYAAGSFEYRVRQPNLPIPPNQTR